MFKVGDRIVTLKGNGVGGVIVDIALEPRLCAPIHYDIILDGFGIRTGWHENELRHEDEFVAWVRQVQDEHKVSDRR